jgi:hypothetical protein
MNELKEFIKVEDNNVEKEDEDSIDLYSIITQDPLFRLS